MSKRIFPRQLAVAVLFLLPLHILANTLVLTAPPRETAEAGEKLYGPIAEHISKVIGTHVVYQHPQNWLNYQRNMRADKYDIIFDGPHFVSWRMAHLGHNVVVKLPGDLQFALMARSNDKKINSTDDLIGKQICGISPPNLSTLSVLDKFRNPVRQPMIKGVKGGMPKVFKTFAGGVCDAAVFRTTFYTKKLTDGQRKSLKQIYLSRKLPNQAISVSARISSSARRKMADSLTIGDGVGATQALVKRFGGKAKSFIPAKQEEYIGHNELLEGVIFGW